MDPFQVTPRTLGIAGAITAAGGACTALAAPKKARRLRQAGQLAAILGTGLIVLADIERHARQLTEDEMYQQGFDAGHREGRKIAKPTVVPIRPCKCQKTNGAPGDPHTGTR